MSEENFIFNATGNDWISLRGDATVNKPISRVVFTLPSKALLGETVMCVARQVDPSKCAATLAIVKQAFDAVNKTIPVDSSACQ
jgi:hypothetical protein